VRREGKLTNAEGEFIASGPCEVHRERSEVTMWPSWEMHMLERERGELVLELEDATRFVLSDKHLTFKLQGPSEQRISVYRLRIIEQVPPHLSTSAPESSAPQHDIGEQPADDIELAELHEGRAPIQWPRP
jgi:hypothetical protein